MSFFLLPCSASVPVGGFKVVYEYANRLAGEWFSCPSCLCRPTVSEEQSFIYRCRRWHYYWQLKRTKAYLPDRWFSVNEQVKQKWVYSLAQQNIPIADCYMRHHGKLRSI